MSSVSGVFGAAFASFAHGGSGRHLIHDLVYAVAAVGEKSTGARRWRLLQLLLRIASLLKGRRWLR